jgi:hypothetical protein
LLPFAVRTKLETAPIPELDQAERLERALLRDLVAQLHFTLPLAPSP